MLMYLSGVSIFLSIATKSMTHPVSFMAVILAQTLIICLISSLINSSSWFGFVLFLIFMGGVMVLFVYMSSLASNENFLWETKDLLVPLAMILLLLILFTTWNPETPSWLNLKSLMTIFSIYSNKFCTFMIYIIMYLLITLLIVSSVVKKNKGPIRSIK